MGRASARAGQGSGWPTLRMARGPPPSLDPRSAAMAILRQQAAFVRQLFDSGVIDESEREAMQVPSACTRNHLPLPPQLIIRACVGPALPTSLPGTQDPVRRKVRQLELRGPTWRAPSGMLSLQALGVPRLPWPLRSPPPPPHARAVREVLHSLPFLHSSPPRLVDYILEHGSLRGALGGGGGGGCGWAPSVWSTPTDACHEHAHAEFCSGDVIWDPHAPHPPGLAVVCYGLVRCSYTSPHGATQEFFLGSGGVVALLAALLGEPMPGERVCLSPRLRPRCPPLLTSPPHPQAWAQHWPRPTRFTRAPSSSSSPTRCWSTCAPRQLGATATASSSGSICSGGAAQATGRRACGQHPPRACGQQKPSHLPFHTHTAGWLRCTWSSV